MRKMLCLDLSTTCTGWAVFDIGSRELISFGSIKPEKKGLSKLTYPKKQLLIMRNLASQIRQLVQSIIGVIDVVDMILIEEVNLHKSRLTGKTLDGAHWILMDEFERHGIIDKVRFVDSDGPVGWRTRLNLRLTENDKEVNKRHKAINKKKKKGTADLVIITKKHLAARYVNWKLGTTFDVEADPFASDTVDAIGIGLSEMLILK